MTAGDLRTGWAQAAAGPGEPAGGVGIGQPPITAPDDPVRPEPGRGPGSASASAEVALQRLVLVVVPPWLASITLAALSPHAQWPPALVWAVTLVVAVGYLAYLWASPRRPVLLVVPLAATAVALAAASPVGLSLASYPLVASWLNLVCVVVGALLPGRRFAVVGVLTVAAALGALMARQAGAGTPVPVSDLAAIATFSIGDLFLIGLAAGILRRTAAGAEEAAQRAAAAAGARVRAEARQQELRRTARMLHDTVVNTLGAVARWGRADRSVLAQRCADDLSLLSAIDSGHAHGPGGLLNEVRRRAALMGLTLQIEVAQLGPPLAQGVADALLGALGEGLTNVHKHAGVSVAVLDWAWDGSRGSVQLRDAGCGFEPLPGTGWRGGGAESIGQRCRDAGIDVQLASRPGAGTCITLTWLTAPGPQGAPTADRPGTVEEPALPPELGAILAGTVAVMALVVGVIGTLATWAMPGGLPRASSLAGVGMVAAVGLLARAAGEGSPVRIPGVAYPVLAAVTTVLPGSGQSGCARTDIWWWGGMAGLIVVMSAIMIDRRPPVVGASAVGLLGGMLAATAQIGPGRPGCVQESLALVGLFAAALAGALAYRSTLTRTWLAWIEGRDAARADRAEIMRAQESVRARRELLGMALMVAGPVLAGIAQGQLDPQDPRVRAQCALDEASLRALSMLPVADPGGAGSGLADLVLSARVRGITVHLTLAADLDQPGGRVARGLAMLRQALVACPQGATMRVTIMQDGEGLAGFVLLDTVVTSAAEEHADPVPSAPAALAEQLRVAGWRTTIVGQQVLAEAEWEPA